jgi:hypothetical protein
VLILKESVLFPLWFEMFAFLRARSFEIAQYSNINPKKEILFKCSKGVEMLKDLIESGDSHVSDDIVVLDEASLALSVHNL